MSSAPMAPSKLASFFSAWGAQSFSAAKRLSRSSNCPHSQDDEFGVSFSIPQEDRPLKPVVLSIGRVKAWRRSEVVLVGGNRLAGGYLDPTHPVRHAGFPHC